MTRLIAELLVLFLALVLLQLAFGYVTDYRNLPSTIREFDRHLTDEADVLYFGDSTLYTGHRIGEDSATTPERLQRLLPDLKIGSVSHDAYHPGLAYYFFEHMTRQEHRPEAIIIGVNVLAFSPERLQRPEYQFVKEKLFLQHDSRIFWAMYQPLAVFRSFDLTPVTREDFLATPVYDGDALIGTFAEIYSRDAATSFHDGIRAAYMYQLDETHPLVQAMLNIVDLCQREGIRPIFYATPVNYESGVELAGEHFTKRVGENIAFLDSTLQSRNVTMLDLSFSLPKERFTDDHPDT